MRSSYQEYEASILVNGKPVTEVDHNGHTFIEGRKNSTYELRFKNNTGQRVLVIPSVDGLSVIDGKNCGIDSTGYVVGAWGTLDIPGWTVDSSTAAKFVFKPQHSEGKDQTYAESQGKGDNQGTIGFMVFKEELQPSIFVNTFVPQQNPFDNYPSWKFGGTTRGSSMGGSGKLSASSTRRVTKGIAPGEASFSLGGDLQNQVQDESLGTGFGKATGFNTSTTEFKRMNPTTPDYVFVFFYDTLRGLKQKGVPVERFNPKYVDNSVPNPFPDSPYVASDVGCRPPPGWSKKSRR